MSDKPWETPEGAEVWKTEAQYWTWLRGAVRRIWADYPLRKVWKRGQLRPVTTEERLAKVFHPSTKNVGQCSFCEEWMAGSKLECDHLVESDGCTSKATAESFLWHCAGLVAEHFRLACKPCHKIQSYAQKMDIPFEEAVTEKKVIAICKGDEADWLRNRGIEPESNAPKRKIQVRKYILNH